MVFAQGARGAAVTVMVMAHEWGEVARPQALRRYGVCAGWGARGAAVEVMMLDGLRLPTLLLVSLLQWLAARRKGWLLF